MKRTLLISRDPLGGLRAAAQLAAAGNTVTAVLLDAAAALARSGHDDGAAITRAVETGVTVMAHDEALDVRAIRAPVPGVEVVDLDRIADLVAEGSERVQWR